MGDAVPGGIVGRLSTTAAICLGVVGLVGLVWLAAAAESRSEQARVDAIKQLRLVNPDAKACRDRGGYPVWGQGFSVSVTDLADCRLLPSKAGESR